MAKLIYTAIASLDGYIADAEGKFDWAEPDEEVHAFINDLERSVVQRGARPMSRPRRRPAAPSALLATLLRDGRPRAPPASRLHGATRLPVTLSPYRLRFDGAAAPQ